MSQSPDRAAHGRIQASTESRRDAQGPGAESAASVRSSAHKDAKQPTTNQSKKPTKPQAILGPFTARDLTFFAGVLVLLAGGPFAFVTNFWGYQAFLAPLLAAAPPFIALYGILLPLLVAILFIARRLSGREVLRIGSLSTDQFASVVAAIAATTYFFILVTIFSWGLFVGFIGSLILVTATVLAPYVPAFASDFAGRAEVPASPIARDAVPAEPAVRKPREPRAPREPKAPREGRAAGTSAVAGGSKDDEPRRPATSRGAGLLAAAKSKAAKATAGLSGTGEPKSDARPSGTPDAPDGRNTQSADKTPASAQAGNRSRKDRPAPWSSARDETRTSGSTDPDPATGDIAISSPSAGLAAVGGAALGASSGRSATEEEQMQDHPSAGDVDRDFVEVDAESDVEVVETLETVDKVDEPFDLAAPADTQDAVDAGDSGATGGAESAETAAKVSLDDDVPEGGDPFVQDSPLVEDGPVALEDDPIEHPDEPSIDARDLDEAAVDHTVIRTPAASFETDPDGMWDSEPALGTDDPVGLDDGTGTEAAGLSEVREPVVEDAVAEQPVAAETDDAAWDDGDDEVYEAFWFAVGHERPVVDERTGDELFVLVPGAWILALQDRGDSFQVQHTDGSVGVLWDLAAIERA